jgi:hypothetical protein
MGCGSGFLGAGELRRQVLSQVAEPRVFAFSPDRMVKRRGVFKANPFPWGTVAICEDLYRDSRISAPI